MPGNEVVLVERSGGNNMAQELSPMQPQPGTDRDAEPFETSDDHEDEDQVGLQQTETETYLIVRDKAMQLFYFNSEAADKYANTLNLLRSSVDPQISFYAMLLPTAVEFLEIESYRSMSDSQEQAFAYTEKNFDAGISPVPALARLHQHQDEYIYFRTDHHWTALGAYYAYEALMETMGLEATRLLDYEATELPSYLGSAYAATLNTALRNNPDTITIYMPLADHEYSIYWSAAEAIPADVVELELPDDGRSGYSVFMGGDFPLAVIETDVNNGNRLLIIKDSYANALIPFLIPHFEHISIVDPRHYTGNLVQLTETAGITDILTVNNSVVTMYMGISNLIQGLIVSDPS